MSDAHLHAAARELERILAVDEPEYAWVVKVRPLQGDDAHRDLASPSGNRVGRAVGDDANSVLRSVPALADRRADDDDFKKAV